MTDESVFAAALAIPNPTDRAAYLDRACADKPTLRTEVEALLAAHAADNPLDRPPADLGRTGAYHPADTVAAAKPGDRVGAYKLLERIGEGGMGEVWVADQHEPLKRRVALKLIKPGMDTKAVLARFEAERQALAVMDHPNIAKVLDAGTTPDGRPFFAMELVKGTPITEFADARKLTPRERLELFVPVCQAIQHAHMKGIIHRDIKPSNVLIALHDETPVAKVIDFGVAKAIGQQLTERTLYTGFGTLVGTPAYMAPEQATFNQLDVDTRADVYALGVLLYELLAGSPPIERDRLKLAAIDEVLRIVRDEEPPRPSQRLSTSQAKASIAATRQSDPAKLSALMRGELDWIVMKALEKDRTRRYDTANGLAKDVQRYLAGDAVEACPPTLGYRLRKAYRKNRAAVWVAAAFLALTYVGASGIYFAYDRAVRAEADARAKAIDAAASAADAEEMADLAHEAAQRALAEQRRAFAEQKRAEEEKRAAEAVRSFLQDDLLRQASLVEQANSLSPAGGDFDVKPNPTIEELLDRAAAQLTPDKIEAKFPNLPFVQAEVLHAIASAYFGVGEDDKALALLDRAVPLYLTARGPADRRTLAAQFVKANASHYRGRYDQSDREYATILRQAEPAFGRKDPFTFEVLVMHGRNMTLNGRAADAVEFLKALKKEGIGYFGLADKLTLLASGHLAMAYRYNRQIPEAVREMEDLRDAARSVKIRQDHPMLSAAFGELAMAYKARNRPDKALEAWREIMIPWEQRGDPYHRSTWIARHESGFLLSGMGDVEGAAKLFEANLQASDSPERKLLTYHALQQTEEKLGRMDAALVHSRKGLEVMFAGKPATFRSWYTGRARSYLGRHLAGRKEYAEAEPLLVDAVRDLVEFHGQSPAWGQGDAALAQRALVNLYKAINRPADARRAADDYWAALEKQGKGAASWGSRHTQAWEAFNEGDHETAARLFEMNVKVAATPEDKSRSYQGLQQSEQRLGRVDAAREHARAAVDVIVAARGPAHRSFLLGSARSSLGILLFVEKNYAEAEPHLVAGCREVADHAHQIPEFEYRHRNYPFDVLVQLLEKTNRPAEAKKWAAVKAELIEKLLRKTVVGEKLTAATVALATQVVMGHVAADRHDDALAVYRELDAKYKPADQPTADAWLRLSGTAFNTYESKNQFDRMKPWAEMRIPALERELDGVRAANAGELRVLQVTNSLAFSHLHAGRKDEVAKLAAEVLARQKASGWKTDAASVAAYGSTAKAAALAGRADLATAISTAVLAEVRKRPEVPGLRAARATFDAGFARSHAGAHAEAEGHFRDALKLQIEADAKHWTAAKYKAWLGFALCDQKKYAAAEPLLLEAHAEFVARLAGVPLWEKGCPLIIADRLVALYAATDRPEKAAEWRGKK
jgi:serine/threonine protein kinase